MKKKALIYGISGQDGHYMARLLQSKGYEILGVSHGGKPSLLSGIGFARADLSGDVQAYLQPLRRFSPDEIYFLAGVNSHQKVLENPALAFRVNALALISIMQEMRLACPKARLFHASSSHIFGGAQGKAGEESVPAPNSAYGISKFSAHAMVQQFRKGGLFACNGILFNHESPMRTADFVTRKITRAAAEISLGMRKGKIALGNLDAKRDWGFAGDYVEAMWLMLQQEKPGDFVIATGELHTVREWCREAFLRAGLDWEDHVGVDRALFRESEQNAEADISKARSKLGWAPKAKFKEIVHMMVDADMESLRQRR